MSGKNGYYNEGGIQELWNNDKLHCEDGPAIVIYSDGTEEWRTNDKLHRVDGPAITYSDGTQEWRFHGKRHREDGPAVIYGTQEWWYIEGELVSGSVLEYMKKMSSENKKLKQEIKQLNQELCDPRIQTMLLYGDRETITSNN